jgi:hypothetical protein
MNLDMRVGKHVGVWPIVLQNYFRAENAQY